MINLNDTNMETLIIASEKRLKRLVKSNEDRIISINSVDFSGRYPMLEVSNKHASYYDVDSQSNKLLYSPFEVTLK